MDLCSIHDRRVRCDLAHTMGRVECRWGSGPLRSCRVLPHVDVILSEDDAERSEAEVESKDPHLFFLMRDGCAIRRIALRYGGFWLVEHLPGKGQHSFRDEWLGHEDNVRLAIFGGGFPGRTQNQHRQVRHPGVQLIHKRRAADPRRLVAADDHAQGARELRLLDQEKSLCCIANPAHIAEALPQNRKHQRSLKCVVVDEEDGCHRALAARSNLEQRAVSIN